MGGGSVVHDSNGTIGLRHVSNGRSARGRRVICDSEDGTSGIRGEERRGARGDNRELKVGRSSRVPPLGMEGSLVRTGGKVDALPGMDAGGASTRGVEEDVDVGRIETGGIPSDVDRSSVLKRLGSSRGGVQPASIAG